MDSREAFWKLYVEFKHYEYYYWHYRVRTVRLDNIISSICMIASASSITAWGLWRETPLLWGAVIGISQLIQTVKPKCFPYVEELAALKFLLPQLREINISISSDWRNIASMPPAKTASKITQYRRQYEKLLQQYIGEVHFPRIGRLERKAEEDNRNYFFQNYNVGGF